MQILTPSDPYIPEGEEPPRLGAVPVRFFGTYAFAWIESKRALEPYDQEHADHARESRQTGFLRGITEANHYQVAMPSWVFDIRADVELHQHAWHCQRLPVFAAPNAM